MFRYREIFKGYGRVKKPRKSNKLTYEQFIEEYHEMLKNYWHQISSEISGWRNSYEWPKGTFLDEAVKRRNELENLIKDDLRKYGYVTKKVFDNVIKWGFGSSSGSTETEIRDTTKEAFEYLRRNNIAKAASALTKLSGIGISRASKVLALSNQDKLGIYDSRAADGLSDLKSNNKNLIPIPPGRTIPGDRLSDFSEAFERYVYVLTFLHDCAIKTEELRDSFKRVSDIEIALFSRSRKNLKPPTEYQTPKYINEIIRLNVVVIDEGDLFWTLGKGKKAKPFWARIDEKGIKILTGENGKSDEYLNRDEIQNCLLYFEDKKWFPLGNNVTKIEPGGLGEYFKNVLHKSPKFASHYVAIWVNQNLLVYRYGLRSRIELKIVYH